MTHDTTDMQTEADMLPKQIDGIGNYYGGLSIKVEGGRFFWSIENHDGDHWVEIPAYLFASLLRYESESSAPSSLGKA